MKNLYKIEDELYIISDKEKSSYCIKECPMAGLNIDKCDCPILGSCSNKVGNIILTTNDLLIKDGVQAIDDEFLEWFVKNPSCEWVKTTNYFEKFGEEESIKYKLIIPKEEPKQDLEKEMFELEQELDISSHLRWHNSKPKQQYNNLNYGGGFTEEDIKRVSEKHTKQETLEEAAERYCEKVWGEYKDDVFKHDDIITDETLSEISKKDFTEGAKWQAERMYSKEEVIAIVEKSRITGLTAEYLMLTEQFKKK